MREKKRDEKENQMNAVTDRQENGMSHFFLWIENSPEFIS